MIKTNEPLHLDSSSSTPNLVRGVVYADNYVIWDHGSWNSYESYLGRLFFPIDGGKFKNPVSGSFVGDGSGLTGITVGSGEYVPLTGGVSISDPLTGTFVGDGSGLTGITTESGEYIPITGFAAVTGPLTGVDFYYNGTLNGGAAYVASLSAQGNVYANQLLSNAWLGNSSGNMAIIPIGGYLVTPLLYVATSLTANDGYFSGDGSGLYGVTATNVNYDHGSMTGLLDNDHPQYALTSTAKVANGDFETPSYAFASDTDTGFFWNTYVGVTQNKNIRMIWNSSVSSFVDFYAPNIYSNDTLSAEGSVYGNAIYGNSIYSNTFYYDSFADVQFNVEGTYKFDFQGNASFSDALTADDIYANNGFYSNTYNSKIVDDIEFNVDSTKKFLFRGKSQFIFPITGEGTCLFDQVSTESVSSLTAVIYNQLVIPTSTSDPAAPVAGQMWFRTDL